MEIIILLLFIVSALFNKRLASSILLLCALILIYYNYFISFEGIFSYNFINSALLLISLYGISRIFMESDITKFVLGFIFEKVSSYKKIIILVCTFSYILSLFVNSFILILFLMPLIKEVSKKLQLESRWIIVPSLICIIIGSAGTLMGSSFSIMLSGYMEFDFMEFLFYDGRCGLFFISFVLFLVVLFMINLLFKDDKYYVGEDNNVVVKDYFPLILLFSTILILIISSVFKSLYVSGLLGMMLFVFSSIYYKNYKLLLNSDYSSVILYLLMVMVIFNVKDFKIFDTIASYFIELGNGTIIYIGLFIVSIILGLFFNPIFIFYLLMIILKKISIGLDINQMVFVYGTFLGLNLGIVFRTLENYEWNKKIILSILIPVCVCSILLVSFLYF